MSAAPQPADVALFACAGLAKAVDGEPLLRDVTLAVPRGAIAVVVGPRGAGKSLLLRLALGLARPDAGWLRLFGREPDPAARAQLYARVGVVWPSGALVEAWSVERNVAFALREVQRRPADEVRRAVRESLLLVGLKHVEHLAAGGLPDGVRRRVALARAVAHRPELLLLDEPADGMDPVGADALHALLLQLRDRLGLGLLAVARDPRTAWRIADQVAVLHDGRIAAAGTPDAVRRAPDPAVQQFLTGSAHGPIAP